MGPLTQPEAPLYDTFFGTIPAKTASDEEVGDWLGTWLCPPFALGEISMYMEETPALNGMDIRKLTTSGMQAYLSLICGFDEKLSALLSAEIQVAKNVEKEKEEKDKLAELKMRKQMGNWAFMAGIFVFCLILVFGLMEKDKKLCRALIDANKPGI